MSYVKKSLLLTLASLIATSAFAADTADLKVIGSIVPTACTPVFSGGGVVDYGTIILTDLSPTAMTKLAPKNISYTVTCDAPISIGLSWLDSRGPTVNDDEHIYATNFGLGLHEGVKIGRYEVAFDGTSTIADGEKADLIYRIGKDGVWAPSASTGHVTPNGTRTFALAPPGTIAPGAYRVISGGLIVTASIGRTDRLELNTAIQLDGLSTMIVNYL